MDAVDLGLQLKRGPEIFMTILIIETSGPLYNVHILFPELESILNVTRTFSSSKKSKLKMQQLSGLLSHQAWESAHQA